ncbi:MAG TPA: hypothetical protein VI731_01100 [Bacteroidia bacterium]|nr:hypothetical protein [Bacteroidia bacterium]
MQSITSIVKGLKAKTEKMLALHEALKKDNARLTTLLTVLKTRAEELENANSKLEEQQKVLRLAKSLSGKDSGNGEVQNKNLALKLKINELVREIDKCIAQFNR